MSSQRTYSTDGPECPHCHFVFTPDEGYYYDEYRCRELDCADCGKTFGVEVHHSTSWACEPIPSDKSRESLHKAIAVPNIDPADNANPQQS